MMTACILPFPLSQRKTLVDRCAERMLQLKIGAAERHLEHALHIQAEALRRRGVKEPLDRANPGRANRSAMHRAGSVLWSAHGWDVTPRSPAETYCSGVNLETVAADNADILRALNELWWAMRLGRPNGAKPAQT
jgi:hypothetical protein